MRPHARRSGPRHVATEFGHDHLRRAPGDTRNRVEPGELRRVCGRERLDLTIVRGDRAVEELDVAQELVEQEPVMGGDAAGERLPERGALPAQAPLGEVRQLRGSVLAGDQRF
jgi:hypothetical protein